GKLSELLGGQKSLARRLSAGVVGEDIAGQQRLGLPHLVVSRHPLSLPQMRQANDRAILIVLGRLCFRIGCGCDPGSDDRCSVPIRLMQTPTTYRGGSPIHATTAKGG